MKKLFSLLACCAFLGLLAGCCCGKKDVKKHSPKKEMKHKDAHHKGAHKDMKHKEMKKAPAKKGVLAKAESEADKVWCDICNMWAGKGHRH